MRASVMVPTPFGWRSSSATAPAATIPGRSTRWLPRTRRPGRSIARATRLSRQSQKRSSSVTRILLRRLRITPARTGSGNVLPKACTAAGFAIATLAAAGIACRTGAPTIAGPNILLITVDTLRADHLGSYGYAGAATPTFDALARRGLRFDRAMTVTPLTLPAHASLMTGTFPGYNGVRDNAGFALADDQTTLAEALGARGYRTGAFVAAFVLDRRWGLSQGFDRYGEGFDLTQYRPE